MYKKYYKEVGTKTWMMIEIKKNHPKLKDISKSLALIAINDDTFTYSNLGN